MNQFKMASLASIRYLAVGALLTGVSPHAQALDTYGALGLPGLVVGIAQPVNSAVTLRADYGGLGSISGSETESGIRYDGEGDFNRFGFFADWFPLGNGFRFTGGLTVNQMELNLQARPEGNTLMIGEQTYAVSPGDRFEARIKFPRTTPYLGIGWGHRAGDRGWSFHADFGVSIGRATVSTEVFGTLANQPGIAEDVQREQAELEDGVGKIRFVPQVSAGISYRF